MTKWYINELGKLTHISVRTLHHYDRIGLLKPSLRLPNGYRLYSEADLLKLQQIIALKFFGFELSQIKALLEQDVDMMEHFFVQSQWLQKKASDLLEASNTLNGIISECRKSKSIPWENIIKLIEVYRMTEQLEKTWAGKVFNQEELKAYASFEQSLKTRLDEKEAFEASWKDVITKIAAHLDQDPASELGISIGKQCMELINNLYGKEYAALRTAIWEKGFKQGQAGEEHGLSPEMVTWLDEAIDAYYRQRIYQLLAKAETDFSDATLTAWNALLEEMCGDADEPKKALFDAIMSDDKVSEVVKNWLRKIRKD